MQATAAIIAQIATAPGAALDPIARCIWQALSAGHISESEAEQLDSLVRERRQALDATRSAATPMARIATPRRYPTSPDRVASIRRRRRVAASGPLPPELAQWFTMGPQAVLAVIGREIRASGRCDWPIDKIAALAGVCRTTVKATIRDAQRLGLLRRLERPQRGNRSLTNVLTLVCKAWRRWLWRRGGGGKKVPTTNTDSPWKADRGRSDAFRSAASGVLSNHPPPSMAPG